jgi:(p)ppGpp synthase/HD superfamily hydrolase
MQPHGIIYPRSQKLIDFAYRYAADAHGDQKRKYTGEPYVEHLIAVARLVHAHDGDCEMVAAALLHDVLEDTDRTFDDLMHAGFGHGIAKLVEELTDVSRPYHGNRAVRKALDRDHLATASRRAQTIKLADLIDNSASIVEHDPRFARVYMAEKAQLLKVLRFGDARLFKQAQQIVDDYFGENN